MTPPLHPFLAERYCLDLRRRTANAPPGTPHELAWLWACAALDVRSDTILIPVLVTDVPFLDKLNRERDWRLPPDYFPTRLARGGCLLIRTEPGIPNPHPNSPTLP